MKPLRLRLDDARKRLGLPWEVLERDYLLSWILAGITEVETLRDSLVFKGGTALKKCYFGDYRFSEDLDFTGSKCSNSAWFEPGVYVGAQMIKGSNSLPPPRDRGHGWFQAGLTCLADFDEERARAYLIYRFMGRQSGLARLRTPPCTRFINSFRSSMPRAFASR